MRDRPRYPFQYPGDHIDKRAARLFLYKHALHSIRQGSAITLAGTDPDSEISLLRDYLKWPANRTWFVDNSERIEVITALQHIKHSWPESRVYPGSLQNLLLEPFQIGFVNLDFMGHLNSFNVLPCLKLVIPNMLPGAILGLTWERGREMTHLPDSSGMRTLKAGARYKNINDQRWAGVLKIVDKISNGQLEVLGGVEYQNHHSPMSVSVFRKLAKEINPGR